MKSGAQCASDFKHSYKFNIKKKTKKNIKLYRSNPS